MTARQVAAFVLGVAALAAIPALTVYYIGVNVVELVGGPR